MTVKKKVEIYPAIAVHIEAILPRNLAELRILTEQVGKMAYGTGLKAEDVKAHVGTLNQNIEFTFLV